ncbi:MAG TPA: FumA C-terminus/TtdB family hydratase beta subunit [Candidatus Sulfotelmatobacter sp.]|jgi:fumarate hydratase subunit beta|nr:FumA C-terminus/TtdB family hydratase beta subunit [Candidatus Sulfotelmatobacter sp.]
MTVVNLKTPISEEEIRKLLVNDILYLSGTIVTARDQAHKRLIESAKQGKHLQMNLEGLAIYHCGPVVIQRDSEWRVVAAGPTTSTRMEVYTPDLLKKFKPRVIIGKGGMAERTTQALKTYGAIYATFTGGAAVLAAKTIKKVKDVVWPDLGMPEAMWFLEIEDFGPLVVAIDSHGNNLFQEVAKIAERNKELIYNKLGL